MIMYYVYRGIYLKKKDSRSSQSVSFNARVRTVCAWLNRLRHVFYIKTPPECSPGMCVLPPSSYL